MGPGAAGQGSCQWGRKERCKSEAGQAVGEPLTLPQAHRDFPGQGWPGNRQPSCMLHWLPLWIGNRDASQHLCLFGWCPEERLTVSLITGITDQTTCWLRFFVLQGDTMHSLAHCPPLLQPLCQGPLLTPTFAVIGLHECSSTARPCC